MSSFERSLSGTPLVLDLHEEQSQAERQGLHEARGRTARTLVKDDALRVTLIILAPGGELREHAAIGPITVQPLTGWIRFSVSGADHDLSPGDFLALEAKQSHAVTSEEGGTFLLTVVRPGSVTAR